MLHTCLSVFGGVYLPIRPLPYEALYVPRARGVGQFGEPDDPAVALQHVTYLSVCVWRSISPHTSPPLWSPISPHVTYLSVCVWQSISPHTSPPIWGPISPMFLCYIPVCLCFAEYISPYVPSHMRPHISHVSMLHTCLSVFCGVYLPIRPLPYEAPYLPCFYVTYLSVCVWRSISPHTSPPIWGPISPMLHTCLSVFGGVYFPIRPLPYEALYVPRARGVGQFGEPDDAAVALQHVKHGGHLSLLRLQTKCAFKPREKGRDLNQWQHKTSITQRLRTDLGRSVGVTIATNWCG